ncbi:MAG: DUF3820 family protein [Parachlamydiales bacterium]|jgi:DNA polymerase-3 subunit epsilon
MALRPIFYDTETTGLFSENDRIIEIAALDLYNNRSFEKLINPERPIPQEASSIHHITDEMVKNAPVFADVGQEFLEFCQKDCVLIAHNNDAFDLPFLKAEFKRSGLVEPKWPTLDSLKWARKYRPDLPRHSLQYLREIYQIPENQAHRALNDVLILKEVFLRLIDDLSIEQAIELLKNDKQECRMPFGKHQGKLLKEVPKGYLTWLIENGVLAKPENSRLKEELVKLGLVN